MGYNTLNYMAQGGGKLVIGGELEIAEGGQITNAGSQAGAVADLTEGGGAIGGTNDGNLPSLASLQAVLTENSGAIGGTNDGNLPNLTATAVSVTDSSTGTPDTSAPIDLEAVANPDLSAWNGSTDPTAAQATAINAAITSLKNVVATLGSQHNAVITDLASVVAAAREDAAAINGLVGDVADLVAAARENADKINDILAALRGAGLIAS